MSALITLSKHFSSSVGYTALSHLEQGLLILKKKLNQVLTKSKLFPAHIHLQSPPKKRTGRCSLFRPFSPSLSVQW
jgi:hypothetical protein